MRLHSKTFSNVRSFRCQKVASRRKCTRTLRTRNSGNIKYRSNIIASSDASMLGSKELRVASSIVAAACQICVDATRAHSTMMNSSTSKSDYTPLTAADIAVQAFVSTMIQRELNESNSLALPIIGEEDNAIFDESSSLQSEVIYLLDRAFHRYSSQTGTESIRLSTIDISSTLKNSNANGDTSHLVGIDSKEGKLEIANYWTLDPIDGTKGFLTNDKQYAVALAKIVNGEASIGVVGLPRFTKNFMTRFRNGSNVASMFDEDELEGGVILMAEKGYGAFWKPLHASYNVSWMSCRVHDVTKLEDAVVCISDHEEWEKLPLANGMRASGMVRSPTIVRVCCGSIVKHCCVALGLVTLFIQHPIQSDIGTEISRASVDSIKVWDHAAALPIITEAGGSSTDFANNKMQTSLKLNFTSMGPSNVNPAIKPSGGGIISSNNHVHNETLLKLLKS